VLPLALLVALAVPGYAKDKRSEKENQGNHPKLDQTLNRRAARGGGTSRVIVVYQPGSRGSEEVRKHGSKSHRRLWLVNGEVVEIKNSELRRLADEAAVASIHEDRLTEGVLNRAAVNVGARAAQTISNVTGAGVGVAVIDSGISSWHDDLTYNGSSTLVRTKAGQRVVAFVDFVNDRNTVYDDNGHGTHVAGTIAGNGYDSYGARAGIAPDAHLVGLKVLDAQGRGVISDVIAALEWRVLNKNVHNIRVANLSVGAAVTESYWTDPLTLAAKRAVDAGIVVVAAAGNQGQNARGQTQYGGIAAPGNAPWVLTVGAYSHEGTVSRFDDVMAGYSSRGPSAVDYEAKPDVVAPGTGLVSLSDPSSTFYRSKSASLLTGSRPTSYKPYLSLSGTSMAAPIVSGTVALMIQANPSLTPNMAKAILQFTAEQHSNYNVLTQGAGFLNTQGAVQLAKFFKTTRAGERLYLPSAWSKQIIWGSHRLKGGFIQPTANAFALGTVWGSFADRDGDNIVWGTLRDGDNIVWGTLRDADNIVWGTVVDVDNIVWGTLRDADGDNIVWGTLRDADNIVWGTVDVDNIVWGTLCGGADCDNIVWGTVRDADNIVWGTLSDAFNIVWGTAADGDNIVWGTAADGDNIVWGTSGEEVPVLFDDPNGAPENFDQVPLDSVFTGTDTPTATGDSTAGTGSTTTGGQ
jgi:serine protease AprX